MAQHFLLSAKARTLSVLQVNAMSDEAAFELFKQLRWGEGEEVSCPACGVIHRHYFIQSRKVWKCMACRETFSVTSGTLFAYHKLPLRKYLAAIVLFVNAVKSLSALQLARDLGCQYKTAFVLAHKIRESLLEQRDETALSGEVEMDGAYVNGYVRPENKKEERVDRRLAENQNPNKRCVLVMRQNPTPEERKDGHRGAKRTLALVIHRESQASVGKLAQLYLVKGSTICADEADAYDRLHAKFPMRRVNHQVEYSAEDGSNNNQAESYFSRFRRMQMGQMHKLGTKYLDSYANEIGFREDTRRWDNGKIFVVITTKCARSPTSRDWCGYWQGNHRLSERLAA
jgi:transposase-like protein